MCTVWGNIQSVASVFLEYLKLIISDNVQQLKDAQTVLNKA